MPKFKNTEYEFLSANRFSPRNQLGPTKTEWEKGKKEGCDIWLTTSEDYGTIVTMPKAVLDELIMLAQQYYNPSANGT